MTKAAGGDPSAERKEIWEADDDSLNGENESDKGVPEFDRVDLTV
jgi:hypothetical protein